MRFNFLLIGLVIYALIFLVVPAYAQSAGDTGDDIQTGETAQPLTEHDIPSDITTLESFTADDAGSQPLGPTAADYVRTFVGLLIVIGVVWGISLLFKKFTTARGLASSSESLKVLHTLSLSPTRTLYLVRFAERIILIGGDGGLRTLAEISDPEEVSAILKELEYKGNFDLNPFKKRLDQLVGAEDDDFGFDEDLDSRQRKLKGILDKLKDNDKSEDKQ